MKYFKRHKILSVLFMIISLFTYLNYTISLENMDNKKNKYYINDLYKSKQIIYNKYLSSEEKKAYNKLLHNIKKRKKSFTVDVSEYENSSSEDTAGYFNTAVDAITVDHPELLQLGYISTSSNNTKIKIFIHYSTNNPIFEEINILHIKKILIDIKNKTKRMNDKEKIEYIYNWIGNNYKYDDLFTYQAKNQSIYNVFIKKKAVCAGFSKASQIIFQTIGIESMDVLGETSDAHMWNIVKYQGKYYYFDSTVATSLKKSSPYYYNGLKQTEMNDYKVTHQEWYPKIETKNKIYN